MQNFKIAYVQLTNTFSRHSMYCKLKQRNESGFAVGRRKIPCGEEEIVDFNMADCHR